jgi:hypothetical protein
VLGTGVMVKSYLWRCVNPEVLLSFLGSLFESGVEFLFVFVAEGSRLMYVFGCSHSLEYRRCIFSGFVSGWLSCFVFRRFFPCSGSVCIR